MNHPWSLPGVWLKGALHVHTTESDGKLTPGEAAKAYAEHGYDFVVFTDHGKVTEATGVDGGRVVLMSGAEIGAGQTEFGTRYHIVGVGLTEPLPEDLDTSSAQATIDRLSALGALVMIAHPYWTHTTPGDLLGLSGYDGVEVFNAGCEWETRHGDASHHWDWLIAGGRAVLGFAVDDSHWGFADFAGGWVMVRAAERSAEAILAALRSGSFYSSAGPRIKDLVVEEDRLRLRCTPVAAVHLISPAPGRGWTSHQRCKRPPCEAGLTKLELPLVPAGQTFRLECVDARGRKAWTNPMTTGDPDVQ